MAHLGAIKGINNQTGKLLSEDDGRRGKMKKSETERGRPKTKFVPCIYLELYWAFNHFQALLSNMNASIPQT